MNRVIVLLLAAWSVCSCTRQERKLFSIVHADESGIDFVNQIVTNDTFNALTFEYIYNGGGVGVGDFNNDGLEDLFFAGNQVSSRLYLNEGNLHFKDVTESSGTSTDRWVTGVSVVDINADGLIDLFLAVAGKTASEKMRDLLFVNQGVVNGIPTFKESARSYGLDDDGYGTMGAFFDYDKDGDLDLYLVRNALESFNRNNLRPKRVNGEASSTDRLYQNNGNNTFTDVSAKAGITIEGYGLGVNICDLNQDNWPDVYVSNDFMSNDLLWINQRDGTFKNVAGEYLKHQTHNGMGVDIADFNNDALADIIVVDMLPPGHQRQKMMTSGQNYDHFHMAEQMGYQPQYMRNTLQLNRGKINGKHLFSEIAFLSGVSATDWSWAPLFADFDNDGFKDLFIANGYRKDVTDLDFIFFGLNNESPFGTPEARAKRFSEELERLAEVKLPNYVFRNSGGLVFEDKTTEWGTDVPTFSNGTAYADLDNDGDLELVTNNIDQEVLIYENHTTKRSETHFIKLKSTDRSAYNQKVWAYTQGRMQYQELTPYRGFQSSVSSQLHFGLGGYTRVDSIHILFDDSTALKFYNIGADTVLAFSKLNAKRLLFKKDHSSLSFKFKESNFLAYRHHESSPSDIKHTRTLLKELSHAGPCMAVGDVNSDGLDDIFIGGEHGVKASNLFIQLQGGKFRMQKIISDSLREDGDAHFFDANGDGFKDLYVASSCRSSEEHAAKHILYFNDGRGNFKMSSNSIPDINTTSSCVISADYDNDGDLDLFVGGKLKAREYPLSPRSYILRNDGGRFRDVTTDVSKNIQSTGMVTSAVWVDYDNDNKTDLILTGDWMPIKVFRNTDGAHLEDVSTSLGLDNTNGWWNCVKAVDLNNDGFVELIAGNTGENSFFKPTVEEPVKVYAKDFDRNGSVDPIITYFNPVEENRFMIHNRMVIIDQIPAIKKRFERFRQFATTPFINSFRSDEIEDAVIQDVYMLRSVILANKNGKKFSLIDLPEVAQLSTINDVCVDDVNADGNLDILAVGNNYTQETFFGRYNASLGVLLLGDGKLNWSSIEPRDCGLVADKNAKYVRKTIINGIQHYAVVNNNDSLQLFQVVRTAQAMAEN